MNENFKKELTFTVEKTVSEEVLNGIFITALEGGSNFWYLVKDEACDILDKYRTYTRPGFEGVIVRFPSERFLPAIIAGEKIPIHDIEEPENEEPLGILSLESIKIGIDKMMLLRRKECEILFDDEADYDAGDADVLFQYFVLGEVVYG